MKKKIILIFLLVLSLYLPIQEVRAADEAENIIRLHVIANSDSTADQALKLKIRDKVLNKLEGLEYISNQEEVEWYILNNIPDLKIECENLIKDNAFNYPVDIELTTSDFPTKKYDQEILPAGEYRAVKVVIGKGEGENWWCVLYPPLCYLDWGREKENYDILKEEAISVMAPLVSEKDSFTASYKKILVSVWF